MKTIFLCITLLSAIMLTYNIKAQTTTNFGFDTINWVLPENYQITEFDGNQTLLIEKTETYEYNNKNSYAYLKNYEFSDGIIEFDLYCPREDVAYVGFIFRFSQHKDEDRYELLYFRPFMSGTRGAVQYFPVNNGIARFQYYEDGAFLSTGNIPYDQWNHIKAEIEGPHAVIYVNGTKVMTINRLGRGMSKGSIGVWMDNTTPKCYFANLKVTI